jgi:hypothetical protein
MIFGNRMTDQQQAIIARYITEVPVRLGALAAELGLEVRSATLPHGKSGQIAPSETAPSGFTVRINRHESKERQRFTLAHEIAHFLLHRDKIKNGIMESVLYRADGITNREEVEANKLAAEMVMPAAEISKRIANRKNKIDEELVKEFAREFRVSAPAMEIRLGLR